MIPVPDNHVPLPQGLLKQGVDALTQVIRAHAELRESLFNDQHPTWHLHFFEPPVSQQEGAHGVMRSMRDLGAKLHIHKSNANAANGDDFTVYQWLMDARKKLNETKNGYIAGLKALAKQPVCSATYEQSGTPKILEEFEKNLVSTYSAAFAELDPLIALQAEKLTGFAGNKVELINSIDMIKTSLNCLLLVKEAWVNVQTDAGKLSADLAQQNKKELTGEIKEREKMLKQIETRIISLKDERDLGHQYRLTIQRILSGTLSTINKEVIAFQRTHRDADDVYLYSHDWRAFTQRLNMLTEVTKDTTVKFGKADLNIITATTNPLFGDNQQRVR